MDQQERIVRAANKLPLSERKAVALRILDGVEKEVGTIDAAVRFRMLVPLAEEALGTSYSPLPMSRRREDVMIRMFAAAQMVEEGYSTTQIGRAMLRNHSSVTAMMRSMKELKAGYYGPLALRQYEEFKLFAL